jgi:hypothetical protein
VTPSGLQVEPGPPRHGHTLTDSGQGACCLGDEAAPTCGASKPVEPGVVKELVVRLLAVAVMLLRPSHKRRRRKSPARAMGQRFGRQGGS